MSVLYHVPALDQPCRMSIYKFSPPNPDLHCDSSRPKVHSAKDLPPSISGFTVFDAVARTSDEPVDPEMEKFQDLLQDYLKSMVSLAASVFLKSLTPHLYPVNEIPQSHSQSSMSTSQSVTDGDYVWDVFIHRNVVTSGMDLSNIATLYVCVSLKFSLF